ncbi:MAG: diguanylate cyclase [Oscillospiraceae bacterium]|nr:diguanylate cyclase [Oscillospiraceae bacterium]
MKIGLKPLLSLILSVTIIVPAVIIVLTGVSASRTQAVQSVTNEVNALSLALAVGLDVTLDESVVSLQTLSRLDEIKQTADHNYGMVESEVTALFEAVIAVNAPYLLDIIVADASGVICIDSFGSMGKMGLMIPDFEEVADFAKNETFISDIEISNPDYGGQSTFFVLTGIYDDSLHGYISMVYSTAIFTKYLSDVGLFEDYGSMFVTDRKGTALGLDSSSAVRVDQIGTPALRDIVNTTVNSGREFTAAQLSSGSFVGAYGVLSGSKVTLSNNWFWFGVYPISAIETVSAPLMIMIVVVAVTSLIWAIFGFIIIKRVTAPPREIVKKMHRINAGDLDERLTVRGVDEYAYISESFNEMLDEVLISGEMHRAISELSDNMLFEWDFRRESLFVSENFLNVFEIETERATLLNGRFMDSLMEKEDNERFKVDINKLLRNLDSMHGEYQVATKGGSVIWVSIRAHCVLDRLGELLRVVGVITNIHNEKLLSLQLSERASYDFLSGLYNRNTFMRELQSEITRSATSRVGVIFIDVDDFKFINDKYGHNTGDEIIKCVASIIKDKLGSAGFAGRFGGDEFVMCVTEEETLNNIDKLASAVLELFDKGYHAKDFDVTLKIKASLGIAISPEHGRDNETILAAADEAMYFVKKNGKSNFHIYNPDDSVLSELMQSI